MGQTARPGSARTEIIDAWAQHPTLRHLSDPIFDSLRRYPAWNAHVRNRGKPPGDEIEIAMNKDFSGEKPSHGG